MSEAISPSVSPEEPTVLKELPRLHSVGAQPIGADKKIVVDGKLVQIFPVDHKNPHINDEMSGFTASVIPGCEMKFFFEQDSNPIDPEATRSDDDTGDKPNTWNTSAINKIELMSDGSYRITTKHNSVYILTGTHTRNNKLIDDAGNIVTEGQQDTTKQISDSLGGEEKKD